VLALVTAPVALVLIHAPRDVAEAVIHHPATATVLAVGLFAGLMLFLVPAQRIIARFGRRRCVTITPERASVSDGTLFGARHWSAPLAEFEGIAHHMRTTLSGVRHELVLVHPSRERSIVLHHAAHGIGQAAIDRAAQLLRLPQLSPHVLYRRPSQNAQACTMVPARATWSEAA
jgi:hypothetical protein